MRYRKYFGLAALTLAWAISAYAADATRNMEGVV